MNINRQFVEALLQKLSVGSTRSVLLNALPKKLLSRVALSDFRYLKEKMPVDFVETITTEQQFSFKFTTDVKKVNDENETKIALIAKRLAAIKYDHDDYLKEHGVATFGFGYPILVRKNPKDEKKYIVAPIFIFPLDIKQTYDKKREWIISKSADDEIRVNEVLYSFLEGNEHIRIPVLSEEMLADGVLDKNEIVRFCEEFFSQIPGNELNYPDWEHTDILPEKIDENNFAQTTIIWDGVFSIYKGQKQSLIKDVTSMLENIDEYTTAGDISPWQHAHSPMPTDPSQNGVLRSLTVSKNIVIQGPPGTGKSQTLTAIVTSAIAQQKKVLIVCEKRTALEVLKDNLIKLIPELKESIALIEDVSKDRGVLVETVRNRTAKYLVGLHNQLGDDIRRFEERAKKIDTQYQHLKQPVRGNLRFKELVGKWMKLYKEGVDKDALYDFQRTFNGLSPNSREIADCGDRISDGKVLFEYIEQQYEYLLGKIPIQSVMATGSEIEFTHKLKHIHGKISDCKNKIVAIHAEATAHFQKAQKKEQEDIRVLFSAMGKVAAKWPGKNMQSVSILTRLLAIFSNTQREYLSHVKQFGEHYKELNAFWRKNFSTTIPTTDVVNAAGSSIDKVLAQHKVTFEEYNKSPLFNSNKLAANAIEGSLLPEIADLNKIVVFNQQNISSLNFEQLIGYVDDVLLTLKEMQDKQQLIRGYFAWVNFENRLSNFEKACIDKLKKHPAKKWPLFFENAITFYSLLSTDKQDDLPVSDETTRILNDLGLKIQTQQKSQITDNINNWFIQGQAHVKETGLTVNQIYNLRGAKGQTRNSLRKIVATNFDAFVSFFPVLLLNPTTCSSLLPLKQGLFDIVIFDEASQLRVEDTFAALVRGKQVIVSGDSQQMPPSSYFEGNNYTVDDVEAEDEEEYIETQKKQMAFKESLLEYAIDLGYQETYLDMHYRSKHPDLIEFSNVCFYGGRLLPMPATHNEIPISYTHLKGITENRGNVKEAEEVLRLLREEVSETHSVGVATFNLPQRNLILKLIGEERSKDDDFNRKMTILEKNGFFVKNLENIQGDEKDVIILSTTFGMSPANTFRLHFGPVSTGSNGYRLLNVILTRAKVKMHVLTSIPENRISEYTDRLRASKKVDGTTGLLAYLTYAKAVSEGKTAEKEDILSFIRTNLTIGAESTARNMYQFTESPFEEEVVSWLSEVIPANRIELQHKAGGFRIDIVVHPLRGSTAKKLAIECDGAAYHSDELAWHYDIYRQKQLEAHFKFHRIWSTNWWRNPKEEFEKLLSVIEQD